MKKMEKTKTKVATIILILTLTFSATFVALPIVSAHEPPWEIPTWSYVSVSPNIIGVGQPVLVIMWLNEYPRTAVGAYGDRWDGYTVEVTKPDGSKETLGPFTSDPVGSFYVQYIPDQVGTYTLVFNFPGDTLTGEPVPPGGFYMGGGDFVNDTYLASTSDPVTLTVQQDPIPEYQETPLPEGYWTRPIYGANRNWWLVAGSWLAGAAQTVGPTTNFGYGTGPESAHIMWARPYWAGGIMDARYGDISYYTGMSYESFGLTPPIILNGKLYYNVDTPPRYGWYCIDLRTGEELYFHNTTGPVANLAGTQQRSGTSFDFSGQIIVERLEQGQIYDYESPNQHGGFPYLWSVNGPEPNTWMMFDAFTGNYICSINNVPVWCGRGGYVGPHYVAGGTQVYGKDGSILWYRIDPMNNLLQCWNTSRTIWYREEYQTNQYWMWRPYLNYTFDGNYGFSSNVSIPSLPGSIRAIREGEYIIGGTSGKHNATYIEEGNMWALSLKPGEEGTLLWSYTYTPPETVVPDVVKGGVFGGGLMSGPMVDPEDGVFLFSQTMTREWWGFDLETGDMLWGPTESGPAWDYYGMSSSIYQGRLFSYGIGGVLTAYNITTGEELWRWASGSVGFETWSGNAPLSLGCVADGKLYMYSSEHSPTIPLRRDAYLWCIDAETGVELWKIQCWANGLAIADGYIITLDSFDNQIYCYGKGPSKTTVAAPLTAVTKGSSVMITGTVTDQSAGAKDTPAIADEYMEEWMEYLYQQRPMPEDAKGVTVKLYAIDPNGNYQEIGYAIADAAGNFGKSWVPPVPGIYCITATFEGSASYGSSFDTTYFTVDPAPTPAATIEPEPAAPAPTQPTQTEPTPTEPEPTTPEPTTPEPTTPEPTEPTTTAEAPLISTEIAILAAVAVACIIGIAAFWTLRKRK
jgi:hypothetical protein